MAKHAYITIQVDWEAEMAWVSTATSDGQSDLGMMGNFWDFHPGCHGITEYGDFNTFEALACALETHFRKEEYEVTVNRDENWDSLEWEASCANGEEPEYTEIFHVCERPCSDGVEPYISSTMAINVGEHDSTTKEAAIERYIEGQKRLIEKAKRLAN